jgi:hypothetical protein
MAMTAARSSAHRPVTSTIATLGLLGLLAACSGSPEQVAAATSQPVPPSSPAAAPATPTPEPVPDPTAPYTGRPGEAGTPVMVVKMDNTPSAQPHRGLTKADIVYVEPVEWGLTRLAAVFSSRMPEVVGPVRSARVGDIEMFESFGDAAFVYSGAQSRLTPKIVAAAWTPVSEDLNSPGFSRERGTGRYAPYNLMADPQVILDTAGATGVASDIGLVFDDEAPTGGKRATRVTARWEAATVQFRWNADKDAYDVWLNGSPGRDTDKPGVQRASSVIVQYVKQVDSGYGDKFGGVTPLTKTTGSGKGLLLRDGRALPITWERSDAAQPVSYLDADGDPVVLRPGQTWILLMDRTRKVTVE